MGTHRIISEGNTKLGFPGQYRRHESASTRKIGRQHLGLKRISLALLLLLVIPTAATPQRYGRPYTLAAIPQLLLQVSVQKKTHYLSVYDLRRMPRSVVTETDPTNQTHVYEGVALENVVPVTALGPGGASIEIEYGSHQTLTVSVNDLDTRTKSIVADTVDGKSLSGYAPYDFVAKFRSKAPVTIVDVRSITVRAS